MKYSIYCRFLTLVIAIALLLTLSATTVQANPNDDLTAQTETVLPEEHELIPVFSAQKFTTDEQIELSFDNTEVVDYYYIADGITVMEGSRPFSGYLCAFYFPKSETK